MINIQGLGKKKVGEVEELMETKEHMVCLTETQQKIDKVNLSQHLEKWTAMRNKDEKRGGGLMFIRDKNLEGEIMQETTRSRNILILDVRISDVQFIMILVYMPCGSDAQSGEERKKMLIEIEKAIQYNYA